MNESVVINLVPVLSYTACICIGAAIVHVYNDYVRSLAFNRLSSWGVKRNMTDRTRTRLGLISLFSKNWRMTFRRYCSSAYDARCLPLRRLTPIGDGVVICGVKTYLEIDLFFLIRRYCLFTLSTTYRSRRVPRIRAL